MNPQNPLYRWLGDKGAVIQSIDSLGEAKQILTPLTGSERSINIDIVKGHWGRDIQRVKARKLVDIALGIV